MQNGAAMSDDEANGNKKTRLDWLLEYGRMPYLDLLQIMRAEFSSLPGRPNAAEATSFMSQLNKAKNRYIDILCLEKTRVKLRGDGCDYIHANWVRSSELDMKIIMAQAPTQNTLDEFYRMLFQENVLLIVCLTQLKERGVEKMHPYWPATEGSQLTFANYTVKNSGIQETCNSLISTLDVEQIDKKAHMTIKHLFYLDWPDHRVPRCTHKFINLVSQCNKLSSEISNNSKNNPTMVIHCSAGVGRSGTLTALLVIQKVIDRGLPPKIRDTVAEIRQQRSLAVQGIEQYMFIYRTTMEMVYAKEWAGREPHREILKQMGALRLITTNSCCNLANFGKDQRDFEPAAPPSRHEEGDPARRQPSEAPGQRQHRSTLAVVEAQIKTGLKGLKNRITSRLLERKDQEQKDENKQCSSPESTLPPVKRKLSSIRRRTSSKRKSSNKKK
ncbi:Protein-tyrosine phosphatase [Trichuris suis]|nr:Protein-tyrosine phosphatase [Trichuris suis]